jgi:Ferritin-like domain
MDLAKLLKHFENTDTAALSQPTDRRSLLRGVGAKAAAIAVPLLAGGFSERARAQTTTPSVTSTLNYLLELEYFEYNFFRTANSTGGLIPSGDQAGFTNIENHEKEQLTYLSSLVTSLGGTPYLPNNYSGNAYCPAGYDFTAGGQFPIYTSGNYYLFLDLAQAFQDLVVRAYIGALDNLTSNMSVATSILQILSVEGRHAAHARLVRRYSGTAPENPKPWITNNISINYYPNTVFQPYYNGEDNVTQLGIDVTTLTGLAGTTISQTAASESFDEPLDQATVLNLISGFILT